MDYPPPKYYSSIFNSALYEYVNETLTLQTADERYIKKFNGVCSNLSITDTLTLNGTLITATAAELNYLDITSAGNAQANKALVLGATKNISGISSITMDMAGTGLNIPALSFNGTSFNQNYYLSITEGGAVASKAVVLNSTLDYSGMRNLSITGAFTASTSISSPSLTTNSITLNGTLITATAAELNWLDITAAGSAQASKALVMDSSNRIANVGEIGFSAASQNNKTVIKKNPSTEGLYFYDTMFSTPNNTAALTLMTANRSAPIWMEFTAASIASNYQISYNDQVGFFSGMRISCVNTGAPSLGSNQNLNLMSRNFTRLHLCVNDRGAGSIHLMPQDNAELVNEYNYRIIHGDNTLFRKNVRIDINANSTSTAGSAFDVVGNQNFLDGISYQRVARFASTTGIILEAQISNGAQSTSTNPAYFGTFTANDLYFMTGNGGLLHLTHSTKRVGINTSSPRCPLEVSGTNSSFTITNIMTNSYSYDVSSNAWANRGGGPFTLTNLNAWFNGNIYIQAGIWATSDRRLKENIIDIDLPFERYKALRPVSYNYKNEPNRKKLGLIAQEVLQVCGEAVSVVPNENLKSDGDDSPEGVQLGLDYNSIIILNINIIKKLISRVEELEAKLNTLL